jgi:putative glutamine amidotransferase
VTRPPIALTSSYSRDPDAGFELHTSYVRSVEQAGGLPLIVAPGLPADAQPLLDCVRGLILTGGSDVDPALFGEAPHPALGRVIPERDAFEIALCREALRRDMPVLAICRGQQVLNVALGGTLYQDIASQLPGALEHRTDTKRWETAHDVDLLPGTRLREILGEERIAVNSFHHQTVKQVAPGLSVAARSPADGVSEGLESHAHRFVIAVQWHPEDFFGHSSTFEPLFAALVETCGAR